MAHQLFGDRELAGPFETNPAIARWRVGDGRWKLYQYVTYKPLAAGIAQAEGLQ